MSEGRYDRTLRKTCSVLLIVMVVAYGLKMLSMVPVQ